MLHEIIVLGWTGKKYSRRNKLRSSEGPIVPGRKMNLIVQNSLSNESRARYVFISLYSFQYCLDAIDVTN